MHLEIILKQIVIGFRSREVYSQMVNKHSHCHFQFGRGVCSLSHSSANKWKR